MGPSTNDQGRRVSEQSSISVKKGKESKKAFSIIIKRNRECWKMSSPATWNRYPNSWSINWTLLERQIYRKQMPLLFCLLIIVIFPSIQRSSNIHFTDHALPSVWMMTSLFNGGTLPLHTSSFFRYAFNHIGSRYLPPFDNKTTLFSLLSCHYLSTRSSSWGDV